MTAEKGLLPPPDPARRERVWERIEEGFDRPPTRRWVPMLGGLMAVAAAAAVLALVLWPEPTPTVWQSAQFVTSETPQQVQLGDGSMVVLAPDSRLGMCTRGPTCLNVVRGEAEFQVKKQTKGPFRVLAGNVEVRVVGTRFTVKKRGDAALNSSVEVAVTEGRVDVYVGEVRVAALEPGQRWSTVLDTPKLDPAPKPAPDETEPPDGDAMPDSGWASADEAPVEPAAPTPPAPATKPVRPVEPSADERWKAALAARVAGETGDEALAYLKLVTRFPNDRRAGVAAFELARLQLDVQNNPRGAIRMLEVALAKGPTAPYVEDALMRLARARALTGDGAGCQTARARYLRDFPRGVHTVTVRQLCP